MTSPDFPFPSVFAIFNVCNNDFIVVIIDIMTGVTLSTVLIKKNKEYQGKRSTGEVGGAIF